MPNHNMTTIPFSRYLPFLHWATNYRREDLTGDIMAGVIVAIMLVPQGMAYALLAGLPPQVGLYASIVPLLIYGLLGTSRALAVGPTALVSLLVASGISGLTTQGSGEYITLTLTLALMIGLIQLAMGVLRVGFLVNFLSHPVLSGFTSAAALVIAASQLKHVMGISMPRSENVFETLAYALEHVSETNLAALTLALGSIIVLWLFKSRVGRWLKAREVPPHLITPITKGGPLVVVAVGTLLVSAFSLNISIVGTVPAGLPPLTIPSLDKLSALLPVALTISLLGFTESVSVAKALASKRRDALDANQELIALGAANIGAAFTGAYPVTGGFSRSVVNFSAGANTGLASILTAGLIALTVTFLMPLFYSLPQAVLAAIILVAVTNLFDLKTLRHTWRYSKVDALSLLVTFAAVLVLGIENGILVGIISALVLYLWRTSRPHIAIVGRVGETEHFRNVLRHEVQTCPQVLTVRVDESLYFANAQFLETYLLNAVAERPQVKHLVLVCSAVNFIDSSALESLERLMDELRSAGVTLHLSEVKGPVMDRLRAIGFIDHLGAQHVYLSTHQAMLELAC
ncbi:MAG: solute carrier family 26 protein [Anaerolineae bacterium]|nr:solute carrier family 26 protein [Anaerolineae bacterium]